MLKFFFNRHSKVPGFVEFLGLFLTLHLLDQWSVLPFSGLTRLGIGFYLAQYLFTRICATLRWYDDVPRHSGIELHFKKLLIGESYFLVITSGLLLLHFSPIVWITNIFFLIVTYSNAVLLYLHSRDTGTVPVNYFTSNRYQAEESQSPLADATCQTTS